LLLAGFAEAAAAEEHLVMPFACRADGGRVLLSPGPPQSYRIVGAHERRDFTACASKRSGRCRSFELHRFDLDCGGAKVDWLSVVAALAPWTDRPNPIRAGKMQIDLGPRAYGRAPMPCVVPVPYGPYRRYGPPGFYGPRVMVWPCPGGPRRLVNLPAGFAPIPTSLVDFVNAPGQFAETAGGAQSAAPAQASKEHNSRAKPTQLAGSGDAKTSKSEPAAALAPAESEATGSISASSSKTPQSARQNLIGAVGFGLAALLLFGTAFILSRRRPRAVQLAVPPSQEPVESGTLLRPHPRTSSAERLDGDEWLPSTLGEALIVLCANSETERDVLKELVKSLRRRWHPDHALDEEDRSDRERKLKQINVAWDIICGKRRLRRPPIKSRAA
jgi:hypothetical protein